MENYRKKVYIATKLFSFFDREVSELMYEAVRSSRKYKKAEIYLPFRDSNMKVEKTGDVAYNIFRADLLELEQTNLLVCRLDGLSYDAGVGFEVGYCFARNVPIVIFTTDFINSKIFDKHFKMSFVLERVSMIFKYEYHKNSDFTYKEELHSNNYYFIKFVRSVLDTKELICKGIKSYSSIRKDVFIDICGCKYEWSVLIAEKIKKIVEKIGLTCWVSKRYKKGYNVDEEFAVLMSTSVFVVCYDENEPDLDTCIFQGYAYRGGKTIIGYETSRVIYYVEGEQEMRVNLMLEQSCNYIAREMKEIEKCLLAVKGKVK